MNVQQTVFRFLAIFLSFFFFFFFIVRLVVQIIECRTSIGELYTSRVTSLGIVFIYLSKNPGSAREVSFREVSFCHYFLIFDSQHC